VRDYTTKREEETNLYQQAQAGDEESLNELMRMHEGLVHYVVRQQWRGSLSYVEAIHAGRIGLWRSILRYDPQRGNGFAGYASVAIRRQVWRAVKETEREKERRKRSTAVMPSGPGEAEQVGWEVAATLYGMVGRLPDKQRWVVSCYYGLDGWGGSTLAELGIRLGCCRQAVHYHLQRALLQLRHPTYSAILRALLSYNRREDYLGALRPVGRGR
jgi:RNA polymerase sigma factor (sigma-70 family)